MGKVILIASGKGGTGKTVFVSNMGALLAEKGYKVVLVDMDMGLRNLDLYMGLESRVVYNVADVLGGICRIKQALIKDKRFDSLYIMAAAPNRESEITPLHMQVLCEKLKTRFDYIIIDSPAGIDEGFVLAAAGADKAVIVTVPEYAAVRDAEITARALETMGIKDRMFVLNKVKAEIMSSGMVPPINSIARTLRIPMAGIIQYDDNIHIAANSGLPIVFKKDTYIYENIENIVKRIADI